MADSKLTALTPASVVNDADLIYVAQGGVSKRATRTLVTENSVLADGSRAMTGKLTVTQGTVNTAALASTGYSLTGSDATPMVDLAGTWNTTGTPTALKLNVTDTASNASSLLMDLQVGGTPAVWVKKDGRITSAADRLYIDNATSGIYAQSNNTYITNGSFATSNGFGFKGANFQLRLDGAVCWSTSDPNGSADLFLYRDAAANTLAQRNGTTAQESRLYGTYTNASNYERISLKANAGADFEIKPENAGTGTLRGLKLATSGGKLGFFGATAAVKPTITGSRGANAALADLLTQLATLGLITDSTS